jgi:hypothetical protein
MGMIPSRDSWGFQARYCGVHFCQCLSLAPSTCGRSFLLEIPQALLRRYKRVPIPAAIFITPKIPAFFSGDAAL